MSVESDNRRNAAYRTVAGASVFGAGAYGNRRVEQGLKNSGQLGLFDATKKMKLKPAHARYVAGKIGARGLQVTGLPLAAVGVKHLVKPSETKRFSVKEEVVNPVLRNTLLNDQVKRGERYLNVNKDAALDQKLHRSRTRARDLALAGGTLGIAALGARAPEVAAAVARKSPKILARPRVQRLVNFEPKATKASNALGIGAIGVGSTGSFNFAHLQSLQNKQDVKKDAFLNQHRNRISPQAETGYKYLRNGYKHKVFDATAAGALGAGTVAYSVRELRHKNKPAAVLGTLAGAITLKEAHDNAKAAREWNAKANKIKAKAYERARDGVFGVGRNVDMAKSLWVEKSVIATVPKGLMRKPAIRAGHLMRTRTGKIVSVRGSIG